MDKIADRLVKEAFTSGEIETSGTGTNAKGLRFTAFILETVKGTDGPVQLEINEEL